MAHNGSQSHFLLLAYPGQGHVNPALEFAKRVIHAGAKVTFVTTAFGQRRMVKNPESYPDGIAFAPFSDGYDDGFQFEDDDATDQYMGELGRCGSDAISGLVKTSASEGCPVTCIVYSILLPWAAEVAHELQLPSAFFWTQAATVFALYYYLFCGQKDLILEDFIKDPSSSVKLPNLPLFTGQDLPSFFLPSNPYSFALDMMDRHLKSLSKEPKSCSVLVNTFDELEQEAMKYVDKFKMIGIGPLIRHSNGPNSAEDYIQWLHTHDKSSVVYVSFGSMAVLSNTQMAELARGLVDSGRPFLWVIRSSYHGTKQKVQDKDEDDKCNEILQEEHKGMVVPWCSQVKVLDHYAVGCFLTHCGWNSTLETLVIGVPVVAFPQWTDQGPNAKLIEDVWKVGIRVKPNKEDGIVRSEEVIRCLEQVMEGDRGEEFRNNAKKWKNVAQNAGKESGSSSSNLRAFVEQMKPPY